MELHSPTAQKNTLVFPPPARFIGRKREIDEIKGLLTTSRLLTLTGPGGCGKTSLAFQIVRSLYWEYKQNLCWVDVESLANPALLPQAILKALGKQEPLQGSPVNTLIGFLRSRQLLLVWDTCEHVVAAGADLAELLLHTCPRVQILTTSREVLRIAEETVYLVPPLRIPDVHHLSSLEELKQYEAVQLFVEQATAVLPSFVLTEENMQAVAQICSRLEGIPLAIEMAAARVKVLSIAQIAARLDYSCHLLTIGSRTALPRHQTLQAMIDWSYDLLSEQERTMFRCMSVLSGSFTLDGVETICADESINEKEVLNLLSFLVDKSLVIVEEYNGEKQYRILETMRQYGLEKLQEHGEWERVHKRSRDWYMDEMKRAEQEKGKKLSVTCFEDSEGARDKSLCKREKTLVQPEKKLHPFPVVKRILTTINEQLDLHIFALGPERVYRKQYALKQSDWTYAKAKELLFYLLCHSSRTKGQIGLALWPDASPSQLRNNFHATLYHLRRALGRSEWITFEHEHYAFNRQLAYWFDIEAFETQLAQVRKIQTQDPTRSIHILEKTLQLYRGDFLEEMLDSEWSLLHQKKLHQMFLDALSTLGQLLFDEKHYGRAATIYQQLISHDNYLESAHRDLMRCYAYQNERSQALRHYQNLAAMLARDLGSSPATETTALFERLRQPEAFQ